MWRFSHAFELQLSMAPSQEVSTSTTPSTSSTPTLRNHSTQHKSSKVASVLEFMSFPPIHQRLSAVLQAFRSPPTPPKRAEPPFAVRADGGVSPSALRCGSGREGSQEQHCGSGLAMVLRYYVTKDPDQRQKLKAWKAEERANGWGCPASAKGSATRDQRALEERTSARAAFGALAVWPVSARAGRIRRRAPTGWNCAATPSAISCRPDHR